MKLADYTPPFAFTTSTDFGDTGNGHFGPCERHCVRDANGLCVVELVPGCDDVAELGKAVAAWLTESRRGA